MLTQNIEQFIQCDIVDFDEDPVVNEKSDTETNSPNEMNSDETSYVEGMAIPLPAPDYPSAQADANKSSQADANQSPQDDAHQSPQNDTNPEEAMTSDEPKSEEPAVIEEVTTIEETSTEWVDSTNEFPEEELSTQEMSVTQEASAGDVIVEATIPADDSTGESALRSESKIDEVTQPEITLTNDDPTIDEPAHEETFPAATVESSPFEKVGFADEVEAEVAVVNDGSEEEPKVEEDKTVEETSSENSGVEKSPSPEPEEVSEPKSVEYNVEKVVAKRNIKGETEYYVKWEGYPSSQNTWEPLSNMIGCDQLINKYEESLLKATQQTKKRPRSNLGPKPIKSRKISTNTERARQCEVDRILGLNQTEDGRKYMLVKFKDRQPAFVSTEVANPCFPDLVIDFYLSRVTWHNSIN